MAPRLPGPGPRVGGLGGLGGGGNGHGHGDDSAAEVRQLAARVGSLERARFPLKAAGIAGGLAVVGDGIAQGLDAVRRRRDAERATDGMAPCCRKKALAKASQYDFVRAARMGSYGFLLYGPFSQKWYEFLEGVVIANQLILGPTVLLMVYGWNFLCMGKLRELPQKYKRDMWPSLVDGWKFWIPASVVNFGAVPLEARVAFMSTCAIFWNFYLSRSASKA
eukprot:SM000176S03150  [mRNA]  locus=s176:207395:209446:+ [translate_table: standard]